MRLKFSGCLRQWSIFSAILTLVILRRVSSFATLPSSATRNTYQPWRDRLQAHNYSNGKHHDDTKTKSKQSKDRGSLSEDFFRPNPPDEKSSELDRSFLSNAQTLCASITLGMVLAFSAPLDANAGFGPSSRGVTSAPPNVIAPRIQDGGIEYNAKKLNQLISSSLDVNALKEFTIQLDELTESLKNLLVADEGGEAPVVDKVAINDRREQLAKAKVFQNQIAERENLLAKLEKEPYWFNYLAAFIGSVASTLVMHPVDTIKTRLQAKRSDDSDEEDKGIMSLYEGLTGNILKEGPPSALYLGVYESVKYFLLPRFGSQSILLVYLASGAAGEMVGSIVRAPAEAIKSTVQLGMASSAKEAAIQVFGTAESRKNVIRSWSASIWRDVPFGAIQLAIFELLKAYILNDPNNDFDSSTLQSEALIGAFAGGCGALVTNPFDIITTRIITQSADNDGEPLGVVGMGKRVYEEGGPGAFLVGWQARVGYWAPAISIFLSCYCRIRQAGVQNNWF